MPDSGDPHIRNKLKDHSVHFEAADWAAMEEMMDNKPKRGFGWIWFAALPILLIGAGGLFWYVGGIGNVNSGKEESVEIVQVESSDIESDDDNKLIGNTANADISPEQTLVEPGVTNQDDSKIRALAQKTAKPSFGNQGSVAQKPNIEADRIEYLAIPEKPLDESKEFRGKSSGSKMENEVVQETQNSTEQEEARTAQQELAEKENKLGDFNEDNSSGGDEARSAVTESFTQETAIENAEGNSSVLAFDESNIEESAIDTKEPFSEQSQILTEDSIPTEEEIAASIPEDDEPEPEQKKAKITHVQIGFNGSLLKSFTRPVKFTDSGFDAGFGLEIIFKSKIGLAAGFGYAVQHYRVETANCEGAGLYRCPDAYESTVKAFNIPISLRYNYLHNEKWSAFARFGMIHNIKREESFDYDFTLPPVDTTQPPPPPPPPPPPTTIATYESLSVKEADALQSVSGFNNLSDDALEDFSISGYRRYHFSMFLGTGFEYRIKRLALQAELNYQFATGTIGIQETRLNALSLKGGVFVSLRKK